MGLDAMFFAELFRSPRCVEVTERREAQPVDFAVPAQDFLEGELRFAVWVDWAFGQSLVDRQALGWTENGAGRREDELVHAGRDHGVEQIQTVTDIVPEILGGLLHRFSDERAGREMHDGL